MKISRRDALRGGTASVAAIAAVGAVAGVAVPAVASSAIAVAARTYWKARTRYLDILGDSSWPDEETRPHFDAVMKAYDDLISIPSTSVQDLAIKTAIYREEWFGCMIDMGDPSQLGGLLADIERLAGES